MDATFNGGCDETLYISSLAIKRYIRETTLTSRLLTIFVEYWIRGHYYNAFLYWICIRLVNKGTSIKYELKTLQRQFRRTRKEIFCFFFCHDAITFCGKTLLKLIFVRTEIPHVLPLCFSQIELT